MSTMNFCSPARWARNCLLALGAGLALAATAHAENVAAAKSAAPALNDYSIGVYYYPGWSPYIKGPKEPDPWAVIKRFPEREPTLGWYHDGEVQTLNKQIGWMADHGIDFVVFDWYWENGKPAKQTSLPAYFEAPERKRVKYALLWANHTKEPRSLEEWDALTDYWISEHIQRPEYITLDGKPVIFVFAGDVLRDQAKVVGWPVDRMLDRARDKARAAGLKGIYFVLALSANEFWVKNFAPSAGFDALSAYNYHGGVGRDGSKEKPFSASFEELDQGYREQWKWIVSRSKLPYFVPMTSGWDRRPWGGSRDPAHDRSVSTPDTFEAHLRAARDLMDAEPQKTRRMGVVCCWNEYGEGSYIEPTKQFGTQYLERMRDVFGKGAGRK